MQRSRPAAARRYAQSKKGLLRSLSGEGPFIHAAYSKRDLSASERGGSNGPEDSASLFAHLALPQALHQLARRKSPSWSILQCPHVGGTGGGKQLILPGPHIGQADPGAEDLVCAMINI
jgi:hypothetical protein